MALSKWLDQENMYLCVLEIDSRDWLPWPMFKVNCWKDTWKQLKLEPALCVVSVALVLFVGMFSYEARLTTTLVPELPNIYRQLEGNIV